MYHGVFGDYDWKVEDGVLTLSGEGVLDGTFPNGLLPWSSANIAETIKVVDFKDTITAGRSVASMFDGLENLKEVKHLERLDTSNTIDFHNMFQGCKKLTDVDISSLDTSNGKYFDGMFANCESLKFLDVSNFDTRNASSMACIFSCCFSMKDLDLSNFNTENVIDFTFMFANCLSMQNIDIENFSFEANPKSYGMFYNCRNLEGLQLDNEGIDYLTGFDTNDRIFTNVPENVQPTVEKALAI